MAIIKQLLNYDTDTINTLLDKQYLYKYFIVVNTEYSSFRPEYIPTGFVHEQDNQDEYNTTNEFNSNSQLIILSFYSANLLSGLHPGHNTDIQNYTIADILDQVDSTTAHLNLNIYLPQAAAPSEMMLENLILKVSREGTNYILSIPSAHDFHNYVTVKSNAKIAYAYVVPVPIQTSNS